MLARPLLWAVPAVIGACALVEGLLLLTTTSSDFCSDAMPMDMQMAGFATIWGTPSCVVLFNAAWVLATRWDFLLAFVLVMAGGAGSEALGYVRRRRRAAVVAAKGRLSLRDRVIASLLFMAHVLLGYLLMLCAMTYQFEFLFAVCVGLGAGHLAFDDGGVPERPDPCCGDVAPTERSPLRSPCCRVCVSSRATFGSQKSVVPPLAPLCARCVLGVHQRVAAPLIGSRRRRRRRRAEGRRRRQVAVVGLRVAVLGLERRVRRRRVSKPSRSAGRSRRPVWKSTSASGARVASMAWRTTRTRRKI